MKSNFVDAMHRYLIVIFAAVLLMLNTAMAQLTVVKQDAGGYCKVELTDYSYYSRMVLINEFEQIQDIKFVVSDETGVVYLYPLNVPLSQLENQVRSIIKTALKHERQFTKDEKTYAIEQIIANSGSWIEAYALSGVRSTENDSCHKSMPFCTGTIYTFPAGVNTQAQAGPNYNCLSTRPNPAWYHLKIQDPGPIAIYMYSTPSRDIDFCLWGPFTDPLTPCPMTNTNGGLTGSKVIDCSYSPNATETANIPNGQTGQYYILIITNFSNQPCDITFQQTSGTGTTDCTILPPPATSNSPLCVGETLQLNAATVIGANYQWSGPNGFISNQQNPSIPNMQFNNAGVYSLAITVNGQTSDPTNTEVFVYDPPTAAISGTTSICNGDSALLTINTTSVGPFRAAVSAGAGIPMILNFMQGPYSFWVHPTVTSTFTLTSISNNACNGTVSGSATVTVRPTPAAAFTVNNLCSRLNTTFTDQTTIIAGSIATWSWDFGDGAQSNLQNPSHVYVNPGSIIVNLTVTSNTGCEKSVSQTIEVLPTPVVNAGPDKTIPYGTNTTLDGSASGGSGFHTYQWEPADKVTNPTSVTTPTVLLAATTDFTLTATDNNNGCQISDAMTVTITGGPLSALIQANPSEICLGENTLLNAMPSGGSGNYTYSWTSSPAGFTSTLEDVTVNPTVTTTYYLAIYDGFNTVNISAQVTVNPLPVPNAGEDQTIPHGTSTMLTSMVSGGTPPYTYAWSPQSLVLSPTFYVTPTTNLYESQNFMLTVTDSKGCMASGQTVVTLSGGPLQVNPTADQPVICQNETTTLRAIPGGGSNNYVSYTWTSNIGSFTSSEANPQVAPIATIIYTVVVDDGYNTASGSVTVTVNQLPSLNLIPADTTVQQIGPTSIGICVYDTITIDAGNEGDEYLWSNGATSQTIDIKTSGISFDVQDYNVTVTNPETGCHNSAAITAYFTFQYCSYGIEELEKDNRLMIYPNPSATGDFNVYIASLSGEMLLEVYSADGRKIDGKKLNLTSGTAESTRLHLNSGSGLYVIRLISDSAVLLKRIIISK